MKRTAFLLSGLLLTLVHIVSAQQAGETNATGFRFEIAVGTEARPEPVDGRVILLISTSNEVEPRFQRLRSLSAPQVFGVDVDSLPPGTPAVIDTATRGFPLESASEIPPGDYYVQAVLNVYTTFRRADGHVIKAHMDQWEGQHWNRSPGNLYSKVEHIRIEPGKGQVVSILLTEKIPPITPPEDTKYVKHIKFKSDILSKWWGHDMHLGAVVVLPEGFEEHPEARYPVVYWQGHFPSDISGFPGDSTGT